MSAPFFSSADSWHGSERLYAVAVFEAYLDASGDPDSTVVYTLACLTATRRRWEHFNKAWDLAMERGGAKGKILHMRELVPGRGQFAGWDDAAKERLLRKLFPLVLPHITFAVCTTVPVAAFRATVKALPGEQKAQINELNFCLQASMQLVYNNVALSKDNPVTFTFEEDPPRDPDTHRQYLFLRGEIGADFFGGISFRPKGPPPLQVADMIAYSNYQCFSPVHPEPTSLRPFLREMVARLAPSTTGKKCAFGGVSESLLRRHHATLMDNYRHAVTREEAFWREQQEHWQAAHKQMQRERDANARARRKTK